MSARPRVPAWAERAEGLVRDGITKDLGRRMCDFAARLADRVMPHVPVRQWVLTVPHALRAKLAFDPAFDHGRVPRVHRRRLAWLRRRARGLGLRGELKTGPVTVILGKTGALRGRVKAAVRGDPHDFQC